MPSISVPISAHNRSYARPLYPHHAFPHPQVHANPLCSLFPPHSGLILTSQAAWPGHVELWNSSLDSSCAAALPAYRCMLSNYSYDYIRCAAVKLREAAIVKLFEWYRNAVVE